MGLKHIIAGFNNNNNYYYYDNYRHDITRSIS